MINQEIMLYLNPEQNMSVINQNILDKLNVLQKLYSQEKISDLAIMTLDKLIAYEVAETQRELSELQQELAAYEVKYKILSKDFYQRFSEGELGDDIDFVEWSAFYQMSLSLEKRLQILGISENNDEYSAVFNTNQN